MRLARLISRRGSFPFAYRFMDIDAARKRFEELAREWIPRQEEIETEQDARFQVIDLMLTEVLGWPRPEINTEPHTDSGFVDYLLRSGSRPLLVVEAKRVSKELVDTRIPKTGWYKVNCIGPGSLDKWLP
jgi:hypothetical protein